MIFPIVFDPNPILHQKSADIDPATITTPEMQEFIRDMVETMYKKDGVGLAAPQVGRSVQLCVIARDFTADKKEDLCLINPTWTKLSAKKAWDEEGCLSLPGLFGQVERFTRIKVEAWNGRGEKLSFEAKDFFARVIQHEVDHLNGILFAEKARDLHTSKYLL